LDFRIIPYLRTLSSKLIVIVDNTWTTHELFQPFDHGADITVMSMTKYYSGGTAISGACIFSKEMKEIYEIALNKNKIEGIHILPSLADHLCNVIPQMKNRIKESSKLTISLIETLENCYYDSGIKINHPCYTPHLYNMFFTNKVYPSVFTITFNCDLQTLKKAYLREEIENIIPIITSFGAEHTRIDPYPHEYIDSEGNTTSTLRFAIGYNDKDRFDEILDTIQSIVDKLI
jgi:cystathionine beta-lyase/cystathionine gamma-synthase